jgi:hypothetical protein
MLHKQFGKNQRLLSGAYEQGVDVYTADIDGDGLAEVLVPTTHLNPLWQPNETILDDDGAILWREWHQPVNYTLNQWQNNACMIPLNPDHDNHIDVLSYTHSYEIAFRYWNGAELVSHPGWPKSFYPSLPTPPVVGDVDGDGAEEIVIGTYNPETNPSSGSLYVFGLDGTLRTSVAVPGGLKHVPTLADANGDGSLDVVYRSLAGRIYIQNFGANNPGAVSWSTHRGNARRDGYFNASLFPSGTPLITRREGGYRRANFAWGGAATNSATAWRIFRAERPEGPFVHVATLTAGATSCTDEYLKPGWQYFYEVRAVYGTNEVASAPFAVLSSVNSNLVSNGGFEENDNSHWDKWFTGDISWTNMIASTNGYEGGQCMEVKLINNGNNGSISQYGQYGTPDGSLPVTPGQLYSFGGFLKSAGISKPSEHWFEWSSTKTAEFTNDRPPRPYPLYFTPHFIIGTTATDWTYANRTFVMPAGFPNIELTHRYSINTPGSGRICMDNVFFRALPSPGATNWTSLIPFGGDWRYSTVTPPGNWYLADFNDLIWPSGTAKFGAGSGPTNILTLLPPLQAKYYFRRTFMAPAGSVEELLLSATCTEPDKPMEIYLNGVRLPTTGVDAVTSQGNEVQYYDLAPFIGLLRPGTNTIAVALHNSWSSWDDVAFDLSLKAITYQPLQARFISIDRSPSVPGKIDLGVSTPADSIWRIESCDNIAAPYWQFVETITNNSGASLFVSDTGQNGRPSPRSVSNRLYRMVPQ